jgi:hypothetical protein
MPSCCFGRRQPAALAIPFFRPVVELLFDLEQEDRHLTNHPFFRGQTLFVPVRAERTLTNLAPDSGLFVCLPRGDSTRRQPLVRPTFRDYPSARFS